MCTSERGRPALRPWAGEGRAPAREAIVCRRHAILPTKKMRYRSNSRVALLQEGLAATSKDCNVNAGGLSSLEARTTTVMCSDAARFGLKQPSLRPVYATPDVQVSAAPAVFAWPAPTPTFRVQYQNRSPARSELRDPPLLELHHHRPPCSVCPPAQPGVCPDSLPHAAMQVGCSVHSLHPARPV